MTHGKREATENTWHRSGDPFEGTQSTKRENHTERRGNGRKPRGKKKKKGNGGLIAAGVILLVAVVGILLYKGLVVAPDVSDNVLDNDTVQTDEGDTSEKDDTLAPEGTGTGRKEDFHTFLLLGKDTSSGSTDVIILAAYDVKNQRVSCMSIPRDTSVNVPWDLKRINSIYGRKEESGGKLPGLMDQIKKLTGVLPDHYVMIEWKAVGELVEALGGIPFDIPYNMDYDDPYQDLHIHQKKGHKLLSGQDAMEVIRWRKNNDGTNYGDTARVETQQAFMKAVAAECLKLGNITKLTEFVNIFSNNVKTDLSVSNLLWFAQKALGLNMDNIRFMTLPTYEEERYQYAYSYTYKCNQSYVFPIPEETVEMVNQYLNPYDRDITTDDMEMIIKNRDGSLTVTHGTLADTKAGQTPPSIHKPKKETTEEKPKDPPTDAPDTGADPAEQNGGGGNAGALTPDVSPDVFPDTEEPTTPKPDETGPNPPVEEPTVPDTEDIPEPTLPPEEQGQANTAPME